MDYLVNLPWVSSTESHQDTRGSPRSVIHKAYDSQSDSHLRYREERWRSEGIQIGGIRSARGILGNWFDKDFDLHGPVGPTGKFTTPFGNYCSEAALMKPFPSAW